MSVAPISAHASPAATFAQMASQPGRLAGLPKDQQIKAVAGQFEAIMLRQFLQESVSGMMGGESGGASGSVYGYLLTDVLAGKMSEGGGLGLSRILQQQLSPHSPAHVAAVAQKAQS
jgi:Rod binding domain-containing protein